jgi:hypothetical protein
VPAGIPSRPAGFDLVPPDPGPRIPVATYQRTRSILFTGMRTMTRRRTARRSHHPAVSCDALGRWHWECTCGAGARGGAASTDWHWMVTAALVHQGSCPGE